MGEYTIIATACDIQQYRCHAPEATGFIQVHFRLHNNISVHVAIILFPILHIQGSLPFKGLQNAAIVPQILAGYRLQKPKKCPDHMLVY